MAAAPAAVNPAVLNALSLQWRRTRADLDDQQNRRRINYNSALDKMRRGYEKTELSGREGLADRGMLHSGPGMAQGVKLRDEYNRQQADQALGLQTDMATIARKRLMADQEYKNNQILATLGISLK